MTPLHIACRQGQVEVVSVLLSSGADVEAPELVSALRDDSDLSAGRLDSSPHCLSSRSGGGGVCVVVIWG
jgi:ankyrin repeat protein